MIVLKKICIKLASLVTSLAVTAGMGVSAVYAEDYTPSVSLKPYQPAIDRIVVDDDLEGGSAYPIAGALTDSNRASEDTGNTAVKLSNWGNLALVAKDNPIESDRVVVSFDFKTTGVSFEEASNGTTINKDKRSIPAFALRAGKDLAAESGFIIGGSCANIANAEKQTLTGTWRVGANNVEGTTTGAIVVPQDNPQNNGYVNVTVILERAEKGACVKAMYFDGTDVLTDALREGYDPKANWWEAADAEPRLKLYERMGSKVTSLYFDNFLVYVPKDFGPDSTELSSDGKSATVRFNSGVDKKNLPKVTLTDENGEYDCVCQAGASQNELLIDFPQELNLEKSSYYLTCRNVRSGAGDIIEEQRILIQKDYVQKLEVTASKSQSSASVNFGVTPGEAGGDVYAAAILFNGDNIIDFKLEKLALDKTQATNSLTLNLSNGDIAAATRVQAFMIDSPENMRIISEVSDISF